MTSLNRRAFLRNSAGLTTGAVIAATPFAAAAALDGPPAEAPLGVAVEPTTAAPREPVMAYVRDAASGEVTVLAGTAETTYRDPALVRRLLAAAPGTDEL